MNVMVPRKMPRNTEKEEQEEKHPNVSKQTNKQAFHSIHSFAIALLLLPYISAVLVLCCSHSFPFSISIHHNWTINEFCAMSSDNLTLCIFFYFFLLNLDF